LKRTTRTAELIANQRIFFFKQNDNHISRWYC
jgi:hypothetical protein